MALLRSPESFSPMMGGFRQFILLRLALDLDLATRIERGQRDAPSLARACRVNARALTLCLDALCSIGLFEKTRRGYRNSPAAARFLSEDSPECQIPRLRHALDSTFDWNGLGEIVRRGMPMQPHPSLEGPRKTDAFIRAMDFNAREKAPALVRAAGLVAPASFLDLGGGPGTFGLEFRKTHPNLEVTLFDLPQTLRVARRIFRERGHSRPPVRLIAGDFLKDPYQGPYDAVLASNILHMLDESDCLTVLRKAFDALRPGGTILIHEFLLDRTKTAPAEAALFSVHMLVHTEGGRAYSGEEFRDMLRTVGCRSVKILRDVTPSSGLVKGTKPRKGKRRNA